MNPRKHWLDLIEHHWRRRTVLWLSGVRRAGKTTLARSLPDVELLDCELPSTRRRLGDPEAFLRSVRGRRIALDEVHRLDNPAEILKIAADHFPDVHVLATGSSTLGASAKFRDTLAGRKESVWLTPMVLADLADFGNSDLPHRFLHGGLPPFFLADAPPERDFQEWMDAFWAKDVLELFRLERRASFQRLAELLFAQSGGIFEATRFTRPCEVSRPTIASYLGVLEATFVAHIVRPYSGHRPTEITSAPKVYAFDTGFVCQHRGLSSLRPEDLGSLWEHVVLNEIHGRLQRRDVQYWRDKRQREVDFVFVARPQAAPIAIECKWRADAFEADALRAFRTLHPEGVNYLVASDVDQATTRRFGDLDVTLVSLTTLVDHLHAAASRPPNPL